MVQILPQQDLGEDIGSGLGQGISSGLQMLLANKLKGMQMEKEAELKERGQKAKFEQLMSLLGPGGGEEIVVEEEESTPMRGGPPTQRKPGISDDQILAVSLMDPNLGRLLQSQQESQRGREERRREKLSDREYQRAKPIFDRADEKAEQLVYKEAALDQMTEAVNEGELGFFSPDNLAELTGIEAFRSPKGAQFISAGKEYFLGSLKRAGARPNQWIEQQIMKMLPKIGRSREANLTVMEALKSELKVEQAYQEILNRLELEDKEKYGEVRGNIGKRANAELKTFAVAEQKNLEKRLRDLSKSDGNGVRMRDPSGKLRLVPPDQAKKALEAGYKRVK